MHVKLQLTVNKRSGPCDFVTLQLNHTAKKNTKYYTQPLVTERNSADDSHYNGGMPCNFNLSFSSSLNMICDVFHSFGLPAVTSVNDSLVKLMTFSCSLLRSFWSPNSPTDARKGKMGRLYTQCGHFIWLFDWTPFWYSSQCTISLRFMILDWLPLCGIEILFLDQGSNVVFSIVFYCYLFLFVPFVVCPHYCTPGHSRRGDLSLSYISFLTC